MYLKDLELTKEDKILRIATKDEEAISVNTAKSRVMKKLDNREISLEVAEQHLNLIRDVNDDGKVSQISIRVNKSFQSLLIESFNGERSYQEAIIKTLKNPRGKNDVKLDMHEKSIAYVRAINNFVDRISAFDEETGKLYTLQDTIGVDVMDKVYKKFDANLKHFLYPFAESFSYGTKKYLEQSGIVEKEQSREIIE